MIANRLKALMINGEGFAFDPRTGNTFNINPTGQLVINAIKAGDSQSEIIQQLMEQFEVDPQTADRDLEAFMNELERNKLVDAGSAS